MTDTQSSQPLEIASIKPLLRGWIHAVAAGSAVLFTLALCLHSGGDPLRLVSAAIFGLSMIELYGMSAVYHIGSWKERTYRRLNRLDHAGIFVLIAGTYTPMCALLLSGWLRAALLAAIWLQAGVGISLSGWTAAAPNWVMPVLCMVMGWTGIVALPRFLAILPPAAILLIVLGGLLYTVGAVIFAWRRPNPFPRVLGFHEIFHLLTIAAGATFALIVWVWVLPFPGA